MVGRSWRAALMAACTSRAAPSMLRLRPNCTVMLVRPCEELLVSSLTSAICPSRRSRGVATLEAITRGEAPGSCACTWMVGKSTAGREATGRAK